MLSVVTEAFRAELVGSLSVDATDMLDAARGGGPEYREMHRALMLADRAAREWAAAAIASERPGAQNHFELLGQLGRPEDAHHELDPAAAAEVAAAASTNQHDIARAVRDLAAAVVQLDTEDTNTGNGPAFKAVGEAAAEVLFRAAAVLGHEEFIVSQANEALTDLVAIAGWENQLGPRFEP